MSTGVGLATAKLALTALPGTNIVLSSSNKERLEKAVQELKSAAPSEESIIDFVVGDVSNISTQFNDVEAILKAANSIFNGKIDHIVC